MTSGEHVTKTLNCFLHIYLRFLYLSDERYKLSQVVFDHIHYIFILFYVKMVFVTRNIGHRCYDL
jgi:hypothetical protein